MDDRKTVLIVSNEASLATALEPWAGDNGYWVAHSSSAIAALSAVAKAQTAAAVIDVAMPRLEGMGLRHWLERLPRRIPVLAIGTPHSHGVLRRALGMGLHGFVLKPYDIEELKTSLDSAFSTFESGLPQLLSSSSSSDHPTPAAGEEGSVATDPGFTLQTHWRSLREVEREYIRAVLEHTNWNVAKASRILCIHRSSVDRKIRKYGLQGFGPSYN